MATAKKTNDEERRNRNPDEVRVKSNADFMNLKSLDSKVDAMVENRNEIVIHNIEYILQQKNIAQAYMCNVDLEGSPQPPQMAVYKKVGRDIPFRVVTRVAMKYGYTPEQLYGQLLDQSDGRAYGIGQIAPRPDDEYNKYIGHYYMAYFSTDAKLGSNKRTTSRNLSYGMLSVYPGNAVDGIPTLKVVAFTNCTDEERKALIRSIKHAEAQSGDRNIRACYESTANAQKTADHESPRAKCFYEGELILTERIAEITMRQVKGSDVVHINLHNRAANSSKGNPYKGGLATMMSTSRGEEHMPCVQALILSKRSFTDIAKEELAEHLYLEAPRINLKDEAKAIAAYTKALFPGENSDNPLSMLSDADKVSILETYIEKKLTEVIKHNVLGYYKISTEMDSDIYKAVCR